MQHLDVRHCCCDSSSKPCFAFRPMQAYCVAEKAQPTISCPHCSNREFREFCLESQAQVWLDLQRRSMIPTLTTAHSAHAQVFYQAFAADLASRIGLQQHNVSGIEIHDASHTQAG